MYNLILFKNGNEDKNKSAAYQVIIVKPNLLYKFLIKLGSFRLLKTEQIS
jgi:hypothetical protein